MRAWKAKVSFEGPALRLCRSAILRLGKGKWVDMSRSGNWASRFYFGNDLDSFRLTAHQLFDDKGLRLVHVEMLE